jgi:hypothetical protein
MTAQESFNNPLRKFKLVFLGEQSGKIFRRLCLRKRSSLSDHVLICLADGWFYSGKDVLNYSLYVWYFWQHISGTNDPLTAILTTATITPPKGYDRNRFLVQDDVHGRQNCSPPIVGYSWAGKEKLFLLHKQTNLCSKQYDDAKQTHSLGAISQPDS